MLNWSDADTRRTVADCSSSSSDVGAADTSTSSPGFPLADLTSLVCRTYKVRDCVNQDIITKQADGLLKKIFGLRANFFVFVNDIGVTLLKRSD